MSSEGERRDRFEAVVAALYDPLQRYVRRRAAADEADDVLSDVLLTIWRRLEDVPGEAALPWSYGVARRALSNHRRAASRHLRLVERLESERPPARDDDPGGQLEDPELAAALAALPVADQEILRLWAWEQLEPRDIAVVLMTTPNAVSLRLTRVKAKLEKKLTRQDSSISGQKPDRHTEEHRP